MSSRWETVPLGSVVTFLSGGTPRKSTQAYWDGEIPWVSSGEMTQRRIWDTQLRVTEDGANNGTKLVPENTVLVVVRGMSLAKEFRVSITQREMTFNQDLKALRTTDAISDKFLFYYLLSQNTRIRDSATEASHGTKKLETRVLEEWPVPIPDIATQNEIADILSAYDDLIENNRRRMALLEESARLLYREWFVHLRFPGHEHVPITDGVPEGWEKAQLRDLTTKIGSGATPRGGAGSYQEEGVTLIRSLNIYDYRFAESGLVFIDDGQASKLSNVVVAKNDVLLNITGASVGRCCMVPSRLLPARVNQHVMIVRADTEKIGPQFLLHSINSYRNKELLLSIARAGGSTREALTKDVVSDFEILVPPCSILTIFEEIAGDFESQLAGMSAQNSHLARARDILLPRLMKGELAV